MAARGDIERILLDTGRAQAGVAARAQLLARGLSIHTVDRLLQARRLVAVQRAVYQMTPLPLPWSGEHAALLAGGPQTRISHRSAAQLIGLSESTAAAQVEVTMSRRKRQRLRGAIVHRVRDLRDDEVTVVDGLRVTTAARTLLDIAEMEPQRAVEQAYATALRKRFVTEAMMREMVERHPAHRGAPLWRRLLGGGDPAFARSRAEEKLLVIVRSAQLPPPELNAQVLQYEVDFLWPGERVIAEVDGYVFHVSQHAFGEDRRRDAELTAAGYRVLRFTWEDLEGGRFKTVARLAQALVR